MKKIKPSFALPLAWLIISIVLLTLPGSALPKNDWLDKIWLDKWVHIGLFSILVFLWCWAARGNKYAADKRIIFLFTWIGIACLLYGTGMEFVQKYFVKNRSFDIGDIIADGLGSALGVFYSVKRFRKK